MGGRRHFAVQSNGARQVLVIDTTPAWAEAVAALLADALCVETLAVTPDEVGDVDATAVGVVVVGGDPGPQHVWRIIGALEGLAGDPLVVVLGEPSCRPAELGARAVVVSRYAAAHQLIAAVRDGLRRSGIGGPQPELHERRAGSGTPQADLTAAEVRVLRAMTAGRSNEAIADDLGVSVNTVRTHIQRLNAKLGAESRLRTVAIARELGVAMGGS